MPLTSAERQKRRRDKLKESGKYEKYLEKQKWHMAIGRKKTKEKEATLSIKEQEMIKEQRRVKERHRKFLYRQKKSSKSNTPQSSQFNSPSSKAFSNKSSLSRAVCRVKRKLPSSPSRKRAVIKHLAFEEMAKKEFSKGESAKQHSSSIPAETIKKVEDFYERDDISRQAPGQRDVITIRSDSGKMKLQKRHLHMSIMEAYALFKSENPDIKIGKSVFADSRPLHVLLGSQIPRNVCVCKTHQNLILMLEGLHKCHQSFPLYNFEFAPSLVCRNYNEEKCWLNQCNVCSNAALFKINYPLPDGISANTEVKWYQWEKIVGSDGKERLGKTENVGCISQLLDEICDFLQSFLLHHYIKHKQESFNKKMKECIVSDQSIAMLQIDFSENYSTQHQDEVQSAHWNKTQITIFTAVYWQGSDTKSAVVVSDETEHTKNAVLVFLDALIACFVGCDVTNLHIWSDGPSSQFKNKYIAAGIGELEKIHKIKIIWNFSASSHGKGPVDAVGGTVKRLVTRRVNQRQALVQDSLSFYETALTSKTSVSLFHITKANIQKIIEEKGLDNIIDNAPALPGIFSKHQFLHMNGETIMNLYSLPYEECASSSPVSAAIIPGAFVVVPYEFNSDRGLIKKHLPAVITAVEGNNLVVNFGKALNRRRVKIIDNDYASIQVKSVDSVLPQPILKRGVYEFDEDIDMDLL